MIGFWVRQSIRHVEDDHVNASIAEHLGVLVDDPFIVGSVVAKERLTPIVRHGDGSPLWVRRICSQQFGDVVNLWYPIVRQEIEDADGPFRLWWSGLFSIYDGPAQSIGGTPCIALGVGETVSVRLFFCGTFVRDDILALSNQRPKRKGDGDERRYK